MTSPHRRVAIVTGANRGIGREIARQLAQRHIHVITTARTTEHAQAIDADLTTHVWHTNVLGAWQLTNTVIPTMRSAGYGRIVNSPAPSVPSIT